MQKENEMLKEEVKRERKCNESLKLRVSILEGKVEYLENMVNILLKSLGKEESMESKGEVIEKSVNKKEDEDQDESVVKEEKAEKERVKVKSYGWKDEEIRCQWRSNVSIRDRKIMVHRGTRYRKDTLKLAEWIIEAIGKENREKVKLARKEERYWWVIVESEEIKKKLMAKWREDKVAEWFVMEDVLTEEERAIRGRMERELHGILKKNSKVEMYRD